MGMQVHWHKGVLVYTYACTVHVCVIHGYLILEYTSVCLFKSPPWPWLYLCINVPLSPCIYIGLQSQTENATNTLRSLPSDDDNDNLPLVLQREESLQVKEEWSLFVINDQREVNSKL